MTRKTWFGWIALCALAATTGCRVPSPDWNGTWKLNPTKSSFQGAIFTISALAEGQYRYDAGNSNFTLRCDGKVRPIGNNRTQACINRGATALEIIQRENGVRTRATQWGLSADGMSFTSMVTEFRPGGPVIASRVIFSRLSGSNGFAGQWRDMGYVQQHADMTLSLDNHALHIDFPRAGQHVDAPLDGAEAAVRGPNVPEGTTKAVRSAGQREFFFLTKRNGKVLNQGSLELSVDGRTVTDSWWNPDRPADKGTLVYDKQ